MQWYYAVGGEQTGPVDDQTLTQLVQAGTITGETLVWRDGLQDWVTYKTVAGAPAPAAARAAQRRMPVKRANPLRVAGHADAGQTACCECGKELPLDQMIEYEGVHVCAECKPTFFQRVQEGAELPGLLVYAGFWIRFAAKFIDGIILGMFSMLFAFIAGAAIFGAATTDSPRTAIVVQVVLQVVQLAIAVGYTTFFLGRFGATPGKMACHLKVVRADGSKLTYGRACGRYFAELLSNLILCIGYLMAAFDDEKRTLHDRICDTRVIRA